MYGGHNVEKNGRLTFPSCSKCVKFSISGEMYLSLVQGLQINIDNKSSIFCSLNLNMQVCFKQYKL